MEAAQATQTDDCSKRVCGQSAPDETSWLLSGRCHAACVQAMLMIVWVGGLVFIPALVVLLRLGQITVGAVGLGVAAWCYVGPLPSPAAKQKLINWINTSIPFMFKATSLTIEDPWYQDAFNGKSPVMLAYHPHGVSTLRSPCACLVYVGLTYLQIFCWGFFMYGGMHPQIAPVRGDRTKG